MVVKWPPRQAPSCDTSEPTPCLQEAHRAGGGAGGLGADADRAGSRVRHHEGVGDHHDHLRAEQPQRHLVHAGKAPDQVQQAAAELQRSPNQISFSSEWRGAKRTQKTLPIRYAKPVVANHAPYSALVRPICVTTM